MVLYWNAKKIQKYLTSFRNSERRSREKNKTIEGINKMLENIRKDIVKKDEFSK